MRRIGITLVTLFSMGTAMAQERWEGGDLTDKKVKVSGGAEMVSSFIWRGIYCGGASIQPSIAVSLGNFGFEAIGSTPFSGNGEKEVDLSLYFETNGFKIGATNYWWPGEGLFRYFNYKKGETDHFFEGNLCYTLPFEKFPLSFSWNTIFYGGDYTDNEKRNYSTYLELSFPFHILNVDMSITAGAFPWASPLLLPKEQCGFNLTNLMLSAEKDLPITQKFALPLFTQLIFNPALEDAFIVFGLSLRF